MSWQHVRGHETLVKSFADVVRRGRLGHAYLFTGPVGVGKKLFARELARALLCERAAGAFDACDQCHACQQVEAGTHPDFIVVNRPADRLELPIDEIRALTEKLALKPARGGYKIAVIDDADDFNAESANAFLKTLEEPPPHSLLILIAAAIERQLPTIISRCQHVRFAPLPAAAVIDLLRARGIDAEKAQRLARLTAGSPGQALDLSDDSLWTFRRELVAELAKPKPDAVRLAGRWMEFAEEAGKESQVQRRRAALVLKLLPELLGGALAVSIGAAPAIGDDEDRELVAQMARRLGTDRLLQLIDRCLEADYQVDRRVQLVLIIEALVDAFV